MKHFPPLILLFAIVEVHLLLGFVDQSEELPSINDLYEQWTLNASRWIIGMGIVKDYIYIADNDFNLVRAPASNFSFSGIENNTIASLNLSHVEVFSFKQHAPVAQPGFSDAQELASLSVFFVEGGSEVFKNDSLGFIVPQSKVEYISFMPVYVTVVSLDDFSKSVYSTSIQTHRASFALNNFLMLSAGKSIVIYHQYHRGLYYISFKHSSKEGELIATQKTISNSAYSVKYFNDETNQTGALFKGGLILKEAIRMRIVLHTNKRAVIVFTEYETFFQKFEFDVIIPYKAFFTSLPVISDGQLTPLVFYSLGSAVAVLLLLSLFCYLIFFCGKPKKEEGEDDDLLKMPKTGKNTRKVGGGRGRGDSSSYASPAGGSSSSSINSDTSRATPDKSTASKTLSSPCIGLKAAAAVRRKPWVKTPLVKKHLAKKHLAKKLLAKKHKVKKPKVKTPLYK